MREAPSKVEFFLNIQAFPTHRQPHKKLILKSRKCLLYSFIYEILIRAIITAMIFGYFSNERIESEIMWCALRMAYKDNSCESHESIFFINPQYTQTLDPFHTILRIQDVTDFHFNINSSKMCQQIFIFLNSSTFNKCINF